MLGIVRYLTIADAAQIGPFARTTLVAFGVLSLLVGALFIVRQNGIKRLMAYSSVEHMGVVALGFGFGGPLGIAGALYHMLNHSLNKSLMFFGAGNVMRSYGSKEIRNIRDVWARFPVQGALWLAGAAAITGAPPFGLFLSELVILRAGFERGYDWAVYVMVVLLIVIFIGFLNHFRTMYFNPGKASGDAAGADQPLVRGADVARTGAATGVRRLVAERPVGSLHGGGPCAGGPDPMTLAQITSLRPAQLKDAATDLLGSGGRMQMAYAWYPEPHRLELRYTASPAGAAPFAIWRCDASEPVPSLAGISPLLSWYEREITDLFGLRFLDHPQPHRLVLHEGVSRASRRSIRTIRRIVRCAWNRRSRRFRTSPAPRPTCSCCPSARCEPTWWNPAEFLFFYVGEAILHYHPRLFFKHRGMEKRFEALEPARGVVLAERVSGVGSVAHALAYCQAVEAASHCAVPPRAQFLRLLLAEMERLYNHLHYFGHLCHTTTLKVGEAEGKLLEEQAKQLNTRLTGSRFLRSMLALGGLRRDLSPKPWLGAELEALRERFSRYARHMENTASHLDRLITTGQLDRRVAFDQGATGPIERASGVDRDLRRDHPYAAYAELSLAVARARRRRRACARAGAHGGGRMQASR